MDPDFWAEYWAAHPEAETAKVEQSDDNNSKPIYDHNVAVIKKYGNRIKITLHRTLRRSGFECNEDKVRKPRGTNDKKLANNISRARNTVIALALCNPWEHFCTFTLDPEKYDRTDLNVFREDLKNFIKAKNRGKDESEHIKRVVIPEQHHVSIGWHMHGIFNNIPKSELVQYTYKQFRDGTLRTDGKIPLHILKKLRAKEPIYYWPDYMAKFGFCTIEPIITQEAVAFYILKYFTKDISETISDLDSHLFYPSLGLKREEIIAKGFVKDMSLFDTCGPEFEAWRDTRLEEIISKHLYEDGEIIDQLDALLELDTSEFKDPVAKRKSHSTEWVTSQWFDETSLADIDAKIEKFNFNKLNVYHAKLKGQIPKEPVKDLLTEEDKTNIADVVNSYMSVAKWLPTELKTDIEAIKDFMTMYGFYMPAKEDAKYNQYYKYTKKVFREAYCVVMATWELETRKAVVNKMIIESADKFCSTRYIATNRATQDEAFRLYWQSNDQKYYKALSKELNNEYLYKYAKGVFAAAYRKTVATYNQVIRDEMANRAAQEKMFSAMVAPTV